MKSRILVFLLLVIAGAGCTDTADSISREYRNQINEGVDGMMFVTSESAAGRMKVRVFKPMGERFKEIDKKLEIYKSNRADRTDWVGSIYQSDGVHLYLAELEVNRRRSELEMTRIRDLYKKTLVAHRERLIAQGEDGNFDAAQTFPNLHDLAESKTTLDPLFQQLKEPKLAEYMKQFTEKEYKEKVKDFDRLFAIHQAKVKLFNREKMNLK